MYCTPIYGPLAGIEHFRAFFWIEVQYPSHCADASHVYNYVAENTQGLNKALEAAE